MGTFRLPGSSLTLQLPSERMRTAFLGVTASTPFACRQGSCHWGRCHCEKGWVGPKCQVTDKFDDVTYEHHVSAGGDTPVDPAVAKFSGVP